VTPEIRIVSSMATRHVLRDLVAAFAAESSEPAVSVESMGGVEAAKRVAAAEPFDVVVLASAALEKLAGDGHVLPGSIVPLVQSPIAIAVRTGARRPPIESEEDVKRAVLSARTIGYSTGPSGDHLTGIFERWGIADALTGRLVQAPPGTPVASLIAAGAVELGFQQLSELMSVEGVHVLGPLPRGIQSMTTFAGGVTVASTQPDAASAVLEFMASPGAAEIKRRHGMDEG
jgi:molybdate transport system substrate-binding protein